MGINIPYLCYHHKLTPFGGCRLCLVEVEKARSMLAACNTIVADGMVVRTNTEKVEVAAGRLAGVHPAQPPARLPGLRQGRRVRAAGPHVRARQRRSAA